MRRVWRPGLLLGLAYLGYIGLAVRRGVLGIAWPSIRADFDVSLDALGALLGPGSVSYLVGSFGWRWGYAISGLLMLALAGAYLATRAAWPSRTEIVHQDEPELDSAWR